MKPYFINNLQFQKEEIARNSNIREKIKISQLNNLNEEVEAWNKHLSQQNTHLRIRKRENHDDLPSKMRNKVSEVPDPLKAYRLELNPEEMTNKIKRKFKVNLVKKRKDDGNSQGDDSGIGGWDTLQE